MGFNQKSAENSVDISPIAKKSVIEVDEKLNIPREIRDAFVKQVTDFNEKISKDKQIDPDQYTPAMEQSRQDYCNSDQGKIILKLIEENPILRRNLPEKTEFVLYNVRPEPSSPPITFRNIIAPFFGWKYKQDDNWFETKPQEATIKHEVEKQPLPKALSPEKCTELKNELILQLKTQLAPYRLSYEKR